MIQLQKTLIILFVIIATPFMFAYVVLKHFSYTIWIDLYLAIKYTLIGFTDALECYLTTGRQITRDEIEQIVEAEKAKEPDFLKNHY